MTSRSKSLNSRSRDNKVIVIGPRFAGKTCIFDVLGGQQFNSSYKASTAIDFHKLKVDVDDGTGMTDNVTLKVWEACGQDKMVNSLASHFYRLAGYCLVVVDVMSIQQGDASQMSDTIRSADSAKVLSGPNAPRESDPAKAFAAAIVWKDMALRHCPGIPVVLLINKVDLLPRKKVAPLTAQTLAGLSAAQRSDLNAEDVEILAQMPFSPQTLQNFCDREGFAGFRFTSAKTRHGLNQTLYKIAQFFHLRVKEGYGNVIPTETRRPVKFGEIKRAGSTPAAEEPLPTPNRKTCC